MPVFLRWLLDIGPTNPIAVRLVQNGSRRAKHMYVRSIYLAVLVLVLLYLLLIGAQSGGSGLSFRDLASTGARAFQWISYLQIALICVLAPVFMAGAIAQESDSRTWDIMLTTPLSKLQIVIGNLLGRLFLVLALLVCSLPLFALTQYFGGVPGRSILASYLIAGCAAVLVGAIAIALSVSRLAGRRAVFTFYVSVIAYLGVTIALDVVMRTNGGGAGLAGNGVTPFTAVNPFLALNALLEPSGYPRAVEGAWFLVNPVTAWCVFSLGISLLLTLASTLTVGSGGLVQMTAGRTGVPLHRRLFRLGAKGSEFRVPRSVGQNPVSWREATARNATAGRMLARWSFIVVGVVWALAVPVAYHFGAFGDVGVLATQQTFRVAVLFTAGTEAATLMLIAMNMAATAVSREREDGTLDLLLTTPITPSSYLRGKLRGLIAYLLPMLAVPVVTLGAAGAYTGLGLLAGWDHVRVTQTIGAQTYLTPLVMPEAALTSGLALVGFAAFCVMVGLHWSLRSRGTIGSVVATVAVVAAVGGPIGVCGYLSASSISVLGAALAGLNPVTTMFLSINPVAALGDAFSGGPSDLTASRVSLAVGTLVGAGVNAGIVYTILASLVRGFDFTVRRLAGGR